MFIFRFNHFHIQIVKNTWPILDASIMNVVTAGHVLISEVVLIVIVHVTTMENSVNPSSDIVMHV